MKLFAFFTLIFALAGGAFLYSRTLPHMNDQPGFDAGYQSLQDQYYGDIDHQKPRDHNEQYYKDAYDRLFNAHVTSRNAIKKWSLSLLALSASGMLLVCRGLRGLKAPPNKWLILPVGYVAVVAGVLGFAQDLNEIYGRGEYPMWYDMNLANIVMVFILIFGMGTIVTLHGLLLIGRKLQGGVAVFPIRVRYLNWFLLAELLVTLLLTCDAVYEGEYFSLLATPLWLYFYLSVMAIRAKGHELAASAANA